VGRRTMGKVLVFGSINTDFVTYVDTIPKPGETVTGGKFMSFPGGKGANQAVAAARSGAKVEMFGCVGDDYLGKERVIDLENAGALALPPVPTHYSASMILPSLNILKARL